MAARPPYLLFAFAVLALAVPPAFAQVAAASPVADLHWLAGCWEQRTSTPLIEEQWLCPGARHVDQLNQLRPLVLMRRIPAG